MSWGDGKAGERRLFWGLSTALALVLSAGHASAQSAGDTARTAESHRGGGGDNEVVIRGKKKAATPLDRLPQAIEDLPQNVTVIDAEELKQQGVSTLDQAVRNVPGITANTGEGGGATAGDQFRIRGFDAANDLSTDGLRDFGVYTRDSFDVEEVQVFLGPSGTTFGRGSFGGAINTTTKFAREGDFGAVTGAIGTAGLARGTLDINRQLGADSAVRLNVMAHTNEVAQIDNVQSDRWGVALSGAVGLGRDTTFLANYFHQSDDRVPYYGVPVTGPAGEIARPLPVDRSTFFGTEHDRDQTEADVVTTKLAHKAADWLSLSNDTRVGLFSREFMAVAPSCSGACVTDFFDGDPATVPLVRRGGASGPYYLDQWGVQNITTAVADYRLGALKSQSVLGLDMSYEYAKRVNNTSYAAPGATFPRPEANAYDPDPSWPNPAFVNTNTRRSDNRNFGIFASEQLWLTDQVSVLGGLRVERYHVKSDLTTFGAVDSTTGVFTPTSPSTVATTEITDDLVSPRVSVIYEPGEHSLVYFSWARSLQPATGTSIAGVGTPISTTQTDLEPTESESFEIGIRGPVLSQSLIGSISAFHIERSNAKQTDPTTGGVLTSGDEQRAIGFELGLNGQITDRWGVAASYTFLDTETLSATINCGGASAPACGSLPASTPVVNPLALGKPIPFAARNAATLWSTYQATSALMLGAGARYTEEVWLNNTNTSQGPAYISVDAMAAYGFENGVTVQVNGTNLLDRDDNYDQFASSRAAHSPGRAFTLTVSKSF